MQYIRLAALNQKPVFSHRKSKKIPAASMRQRNPLTNIVAWLCLGLDSIIRAGIPKYINAPIMANAILKMSKKLVSQNLFLLQILQRRRDLFGKYNCSAAFWTHIKIAIGFITAFFTFHIHPHCLHTLLYIFIDGKICQEFAGKILQTQARGACFMRASKIIFRARRYLRKVIARAVNYPLE